MSVSVTMTKSKTKSLTSNNLKPDKTNQKIQENGGRGEGGGECSNLFEELIPSTPSPPLYASHPGLCLLYLNLIVVAIAFMLTKVRKDKYHDL